MLLTFKKIYIIIVYIIHSYFKVINQECVYFYFNLEYIMILSNLLKNLNNRTFTHPR